MSAYNLLKSGTVVLGLATGSAALAAGINSLGNLMGGDTWDRAASAISPLPDTSGAYVAEGGTVTKADLTLLDLGQDAATYAAGGSYVSPRVVSGAGSYAAKTEVAAARRARLAAQGYDIPSTLGGSTQTPTAVAKMPTVVAVADTPVATPAAARPANTTSDPSSSVLAPAQQLATLSPSSDDNETVGTPTLLSGDPDADPIVTAVIAPVPVPAGGLLLASALIGMGVLRRKRS